MHIETSLGSLGRCLVASGPLSQPAAAPQYKQNEAWQGFARVIWLQCAVLCCVVLCVFMWRVLPVVNMSSAVRVR